MARKRITRLMGLLAVVTVWVGVAPAASAQTRSEALAHLQALYNGSQPDSPARFRIIEEMDRISVAVTEHAQFRAAESVV